jgi:Protein of unknown function (DUF3341)
MKFYNKEILYGLYNDETELLRAVKKAGREHLDIWDVFSPFPVHGLDPILGLEESRLHQAGFIYGMTGTLTALLFMSWAVLQNWPIIFGNKPFWPVPAYIPVTFELTVLFASIGMTVTFYTICGMGPGVKNPTLDDRITDDKFCVAFDVSGASSTEVESLKGFFNNTGAAEVNTKRI